MSGFVCVDRGKALPLGATWMEGGINFAIFSEHATQVWLAMFRPGAREPFHELALSGDIHRTGNIWHVWIDGLPEDVEYAWRMDRKPNDQPEVYRYDPSIYLLDPYATVLVGGETWGSLSERRCALARGHFNWGGHKPLNVPLAESIIYELHVRGFTRHASSGVAAPGTYLGLTEKIPYLKDLGVTAVELLPVYEFEEADTNRSNPMLGNQLLNLWGYQPIGFFAPNAAFAHGREAGSAVHEFKQMVRAFHEAEIEVILDVVFNHTAEGDERGLTRSFRGIDNPVYYLLGEQGRYLNFTGCGNTLNCNHPVVRKLITDCLRYWVMEMHVDGFRFDLASVLGRGRDGEPLASPPLLERLAYDPVLAGTKLIAEAWDAAGLYQVGSFPSWGRWAEWNGKYRDDLRKFVKSDNGMVPRLAQRIQGSPDLYAVSERQSQHSINFITCHDGFTMADLVSYDEKHNEANGEANQDGANDNYSWNCGVEGETSAGEVLSLRRRQIRNFLTLLMMSGGVPMLLAGDEMARTQGGNNNAYCQDNDTSWVNWQLAKENADLVEYVRRLAAFRRGHDAFAHINWGLEAGAEHTEVIFHGIVPFQPDWGENSHALAAELKWRAERIYVIANSYWEKLRFELPGDGSWVPVFDTGRAEQISGNFVELGARSVLVLESRA
ncbi:MAG: glycogen-debranching protein [Acidobacteria bacterium]|nr:glycogen-debranching protein [Acidobacteriota bacterium]